jgi:hypothetical protein
MDATLYLTFETCGFWLALLLLLINIKLLDFVHRPDFYKQKTQRFGNWISFRLQARGGGHILYRKNKKLAFPQAMPEQKKVNHWKQGDYKHLTAGSVRTL